MTWGERFQDWIDQHDVTHTWLARQLNVTQPCVSLWIAGKRPITVRDFERLCRAAKADPAYILTGKVTIGKAEHDALRKALASTGL